jgi:hypothetical protein
LLLIIFLVACGLVLGSMTVARAQSPKYTVAIIPDYCDVEPGQKYEFKAKLLRKGKLKSPHHHWEWTCTGGHFLRGQKTPEMLIGRNVWQAPFKPGRYQVSVTTERAKHLNQWGRATVVVRKRRPPPRPVYRLALDTKRITLKCGESHQFSVNTTGISRRGLVWSCTGGDITSRGLYTAPRRRSGSFLVKVSAPRAGLSDTCAVTVVRPRPVYRLALNARQLSLNAGESYRFRVTATGISRRELIWSCTGGMITSRGYYTAPFGVSGTFLVKVYAPRVGLSDTCTVTVTMPIVVARIEVQPKIAALVPGQRNRFSAAVYDQFGRMLRGIVLQWAADGGIIDQTGLFTAGNRAGRYRIVARDAASGVTGVATVTIRPRVRLVIISPRVVRLRPGESIQFNVQAYDDFNRPVPCRVTWSATDGVIDSRGIYTAGPNVGHHFKIKVQHRGSGAFDTADVFVCR